jgi:O-antigen/teichoic acid export membrane protein
VKQLLIRMSPAALHPLYERIKASPLGYRLAKGAFWSLSGSMLTRGLGLLSAILVGRMLGKKEYGELGIIQNTIGMFGALAGCGMGLTANKYVAEFRSTDPARAGRIIAMASATAWFTSAGMAVVLVVCAPWLAANTLAAPQLSGLLQIGALLLLLSGVNGAQMGAMAGFEAFKKIARINFIAGVLTFPLMVAWAWMFGVTGAVWALVSSQFFNCVMSYFAVRQEARHHGIALAYTGCFSEMGLFWKFSLPSVLIGVLDSVVHWGAGALVVNRMGGYADMGVYNAAMRVRSIPEGVLAMLIAPIIPMLSEAFGKSDSSSYNKTLRMFLIMCVLTIVPVCLVQSAAPDLTLLPFGNEYRGHPSLVQWLMLHSIFISLGTCVGYVLVTVGRVWLVWSLSLVFAISYALLSVLLVPHYGVAGYAASDTIAYIISTLLSVAVLYRNYPEMMRYIGWGRLAVPSLLIFAICAVGNFFLPFSWTIALGIAVALSFAVIILIKYAR